MNNYQPRYWLTVQHFANDNRPCLKIGDALKVVQTTPREVGDDEHDLERTGYLLELEPEAVAANRPTDSSLEPVAADEKRKVEAEVWEKAIAIAQDVGTVAFKERQKQFTSKSRSDLIIMQDVADGIAAALQAAAKGEQ